MRSYSLSLLKRLTRFYTIKRVHPTREDISESSSNSLKNFLQPHQNVRLASVILLPSSTSTDAICFLGWFATKIFHPNVGANGEICVNTLKKDWKSTYGIGHILVTVKCLLIYPNPESALDEEAGKLLLENYSSYCDRAKLITSVHATPRVKPAEFNTPSPPQEEPPVASSSKDTTPTSSSVPLPDSIDSHVASTPKVSNSPTTTSPSSPLSTSLSSKAAPTSFTMPVVTRKSASPGPQVSLKSSLSLEKEGLNVSGSQKERHPSPSPLGTADANVGNNGKPRMGMGMGMASTAGVGGVPGNKAVKRSATGSAATGAEKRKKALKRL